MTRIRQCVHPVEAESEAGAIGRVPLSNIFIHSFVVRRAQPPLQKKELAFSLCALARQRAGCEAGRNVFEGTRLQQLSTRAQLQQAAEACWRRQAAASMYLFLPDGQRFTRRFTAAQ